MFKYVILLNPGHNRVYFDASKKLVLVEFKVASEILSKEVLIFGIEKIFGIDYLVFETNDKLLEEDMILLSRLSFTYAIFRVIKVEDDIHLKPIYKHSSYYFNDDISMILKYSGKTNELFTKFMINIAFMIYSKDKKSEEPLLLLDPVCGKGTSLFEGLLLGMSSYGIDINSKYIHDSYIYLKKYLETKKYKHSVSIEKFTDPINKFRSNKIKFQLAKNKEDKKFGNVLNLQLISGDSRFANSFFKKDTFHIIFGDLPYGVQHGSKVRNTEGFTRNPKEFLDNCLPAWIKVLKPGGVLLLSWNSFVLKRDSMENILKDNGLAVVMNDDKRAFEHRVDQSINRDIVIAIKPNK